MFIQSCRCRALNANVDYFMPQLFLPRMVNKAYSPGFTTTKSFYKLIEAFILWVNKKGIIFFYFTICQHSAKESAHSAVLRKCILVDFMNIFLVKYFFYISCTQRIVHIISIHL